MIREMSPPVHWSTQQEPQTHREKQLRQTTAKNSSSQQPAIAARYTESTGHSTDVDQMLGQRRRRWTSSKTACGECLMFVGIQRVWVWVWPDKFKLNQLYYHIISVQYIWLYTLYLGIYIISGTLLKCIYVPIQCWYRYYRIHNISLKCMDQR